MKYYEVTLYVEVEARDHRHAGLLIMREMRDAGLNDVRLWSVTDGVRERRADGRDLDLDYPPEELDYEGV